MKKFSYTYNQGFTITETVIVMGLVVMLILITTSSLISGRQRASVLTSAQQLASDLRQQQLYAMVGKTQSGTSPTDYAIHFETHQYVLFVGDIYNASAATNIVVPLDASLQLTGITFPAGNLIFTRLSGDIANYQLNQSSLTITDTQTGTSRNVQLNKRGVFIQGP